MGKARILVVEDEVIIARDIERTLMRLGYEVLSLAISAEEALFKVAELSPDLILMDIHLSSEIDGIGVAEEIRKRDNAPPIVFLTAHSDEATLRRAQISGPFGYIIKPFDERELEIAIEIARYRYAVETRLQAVERWFAMTLRSLGDGVIATDLNGTITYLNAMAESLTGWSQVQAIGQPYQTILQLLDETRREPVSNLSTRVAQEGVLVELRSTLLITHNGSELPVDHSATPLRDDHGTPIGMVVIFRDATTRRQIEATLRDGALRDPLTGLANRRLLNERLRYLIEQAANQPARQFAILYLDLDRFKQINDTFGHSVGDQLLVAIARRLEQGLRSEDIVARLGGDEFVVLLDHITEAHDAVFVAERILAQMQVPVELAAQPIMMATSIGIALSHPRYREPDDLLRDADLALYRAKAQGRGGYAIFAGTAPEA